jgi:hypothetical protein
MRSLPKEGEGSIHESTDAMFTTTFQIRPRFEAGWRTPTREQQATFRKVVLVRSLPGHSGFFEMSWGDDGRTAFTHGTERVPGEPHVIWYGIAIVTDRPPASGV